MLSGGLKRKESARVGTAAYWLEVFAEQTAREAERRRARDEDVRGGAPVAEVAPPQPSSLRPGTPPKP